MNNLSVIILTICHKSGFLKYQPFHFNKLRKFLLSTLSSGSLGLKRISCQSLRVQKTSRKSFQDPFRMVLSLHLIPKSSKIWKRGGRVNLWVPWMRSESQTKPQSNQTKPQSKPVFEDTVTNNSGTRTVGQRIFNLSPGPPNKEQNWENKEQN